MYTVDPFWENKGVLQKVIFIITDPNQLKQFNNPNNLIFWSLNLSYTQLRDRERDRIHFDILRTFFINQGCFVNSDAIISAYKWLVNPLIYLSRQIELRIFLSISWLLLLSGNLDFQNISMQNSFPSMFLIQVFPVHAHNYDLFTVA